MSTPDCLRRRVFHREAWEELHTLSPPQDLPTSLTAQLAPMSSKNMRPSLLEEKGSAVSLGLEIMLIT